MPICCRTGRATTCSAGTRCWRCRATRRRICSMRMREFKAFSERVEKRRTSNVELGAPEEITLAKYLLNFGLTLEAVAEEYRPNFLCNYLFELAGHFTRFYENCPVLKSEGATRESRLVLCDLTAKVLKQGLNVLGIETLEQM